MISWFAKKKEPTTGESPSEKTASSNDPLLERAALLKKKAESRSRQKSVSDDQSPVAGLFANIVFVQRCTQVAHTLWSDYLSPVFGFLYPLFVWIAALYRRVFNRFAFLPDASGEHTVFCRKRSALTVVIMGVASLVMMHVFTFRVIPFTFAFGYDAVAVNLFSYEDTLVFSKPDWVSGEKGVISVFACRRYPCVGQDDSIEFRIRDSVYLDVIRTLTRFEPHDPGELAGAFLSEENKCTIKAYGVRVKYLHLHPYIIEATCTPIQS